MSATQFFNLGVFAFFLFLCSCESNPSPLTSEQKRENQAKLYFEKGLKADEEGNPEIANIYYSMGIRIKSDYVEAYYRRANNNFDRYEDEEAIDDYTQVLVYDAKYKNTRFNRGLAFLSIGQHEKALADFLQVINDDPQEVEANKYMGIIYLDYLNEPSRAAPYLRRYLSLGGKDVRVTNWLNEISEGVETENPLNQQGGQKK